MKITKFNKIELHDSDIDELHFYFRDKIIKIVASVYNETTEGYDFISMVFTNIDGLKIEELNINNFEPIEINYAQASQDGDNISIEFILLIENCEMSLKFICKEIQMDLSEELYLQHLKRG